MKRVFHCPEGEQAEICSVFFFQGKGLTVRRQKQRISLARALYAKATYILLDDCLSVGNTLLLDIAYSNQLYSQQAVDSHTAKWIYEKW